MMNRIFYPLLLILTLCKPSSEEDERHQFTNNLINESSPYLLQHAHNPVDWYPWGRKALNKAKTEDKLLVISIGYAACHWCHVMEEESFEDTTVARLMNEHFVSIKIDREERPDIDQIYMDASILINGSGGWPLNVIALPDGKPVFAGTYYPKENWIKTLNYFKEAFENNRNRLEDQAELITQGIASLEIVPETNETQTINLRHLEETVAMVNKNIDPVFGGKIGAPKFPVPSLFEFLLAYAELSGDSTSLASVEITLENMIKGGIYDQLAGGFARYATDEKWRIPHFEKMIYDNAQIISLLAHAYKATRNDLFLKKMKETLRFVDEELTSKEGIFYSSLNADSEGEEGKYYTWTALELKEILGDDFEVFKNYYNVTDEGNWEENRNILYLNTNLDWADSLNITNEELETIIERAQNKVLEARNNRVKPSLDDKSITAWNGLMISALVNAYQVTSEEQYIKKAIKAAEFIISSQIRPDGSIFRNYKDGKASITAFLDDYAFLIRGFLDLYQSTLNTAWLDASEKLLDHVFDNFSDSDNPMFYYTSSKGDELIVRKIQLNDAVLPSSNAVMASNLWVLGTLLYNEQYLDRSQRMLDAILPEMMENPIYFNHWLNLELKRLYPFYEVAVVGPQAKQKVVEIQKHYLPNAIFLGGSEEGNLELLQNKLVAGKTMVYVCRKKACKLPTENIDQALDLIK